ncbi:hypothetical protein K474DRAFT_1713973 [Panus rudis PR-1116 ss-1]|nr:hypothetical protein K474DRAFT_1713973 [Panus rudis PR-1116 ss-1]
MSRSVDPTSHHYPSTNDHDPDPDHNAPSNDHSEVNFPGQLQAMHIEKNYGIVISVIQAAGPDSTPGPVVQVNYPRLRKKQGQEALSADSDSEPEAETSLCTRKKPRICQLCGQLQNRGLAVLREGRVPQESHRDSTLGRPTEQDVGEVVPDSETEPEEPASGPAKASPRKRR